MINVVINKNNCQVKEGITILEAAREAGFEIPTLCYLKDINCIGACRVCVVEVKNARNLVTACNTVVSEGMVITTNSKRVINARKITLELILSDHEKKCLHCVRGGNCELAELAREYGCEAGVYRGAENAFEVDTSTEYMVRDNNKCILCRRCEAVCKHVQNVGAINAASRGFKTHISCAFEEDLNESKCVACGQCINVCPTGALSEKDDTGIIFNALEDGTKHVVAITAPAVRVALGEEFGYDIGTYTRGKMVSALKMLGFNKVFDVGLAADLTIMEEGYEFLARLQNEKSALPMITSCSPGWIRYIEFNYPELLPHVSSCKSPQQMFGAVLKTYYAEKQKIDPRDIYVVSVMPCIAKKAERIRDHQNASGYPDIDAVITTRELARMIKRAGISYNKLNDSSFDNPLDSASSAGLIFGASGGVMEAALRTVSEVITGKDSKTLDYNDVRGTSGLKTAEYTIADKKINVAAASSLSIAKELLEEIKRGESKYQFIEIMTCPGGCVNGGGQPIVSSKIRNSLDYTSVRAAAIYNKDKQSQLRKSHKNPLIKKLYSEYFGQPNSEKAHTILHTKYSKR